jgi:RimJ/RimL family protein N-acetyltransferase
MKVLETERLSLRHLTPKDADFILELVNEPAFLQNIGDRGVRTAADARRYIEDGPVASYARNGFGLYLVELKEAGVPIGMCGLIKRDVLEDVDIGYAFLKRFWSKGYAYEAASAVLDYGYHVLGLKRIVAITAPDNVGSVRVLEKIGLRFERIINLPTIGGESKLFVPHD